MSDELKSRSCLTIIILSACAAFYLRVLHSSYVCYILRYTIAPCAAFYLRVLHSSYVCYILRYTIAPCAAF